jgi:hypothetical protein
MSDTFEFTLNNPLTEEQWDQIADVDFDNTDRIWFHTKHGKEVEFVKVRHGKWIPCMMESRGFTDMFKCSECKRYSYYAHPVKCRNYKYCSYCGARMDLDNG